MSVCEILRETLQYSSNLLENLQERSNLLESLQESTSLLESLEESVQEITSLLESLQKSIGLISLSKQRQGCINWRQKCLITLEDDELATRLFDVWRIYQIEVRGMNLSIQDELDWLNNEIDEKTLTAEVALEIIEDTGACYAFVIKHGKVELDYSDDDDSD